MSRVEILKATELKWVDLVVRAVFIDDAENFTEGVDDDTLANAFGVYQQLPADKDGFREDQWVADFDTREQAENFVSLFESLMANRVMYKTVEDIKKLLSDTDGLVTFPKVGEPIKNGEGYNDLVTMVNMFGQATIDDETVFLSDMNYPKETIHKLYTLVEGQIVNK